MIDETFIRHKILNMFENFRRIKTNQDVRKRLQPHSTNTTND